jgi:hypothetical protein
MMILFLSVLFSGCITAQTPTQDQVNTPLPTLSTTPTNTLIPSDTPTLVPSLTLTEFPTDTPSPSPPPLAKIKLTSPAFSSGGMIPVKYSRDGEDISPPLSWSDPPDGTQSFVILVISDPMPDGGGNWVQWALYNIPANIRSLPEAVVPDEGGRLPDGSQHLENSWQELKYGGPNTQHFETRRFFFYIYALDEAIDPDIIEEISKDTASLSWIGSTKDILLEAMEGHILAKGRLTCKYKGQ